MFKRSLFPAAVVAVLMLLFAGCAALPPAEVAARTTQARLPLYGHRNWVAVVDSAYPAQNAPGIETVHVGGEHAEVVRAVAAALKRAPHVRPHAYLDAEFARVGERAAPGVSALRARMDAALSGVPVERVPHEAVIRRLGEVAKDFRVLILKTDGRTAYSSVFLELRCGYWSDESERALREAPAGVSR